jgi:hypothetical protein
MVGSPSLAITDAAMPVTFGAAESAFGNAHPIAAKHAATTMITGFILFITNNL